MRLLGYKLTLLVGVYLISVGLFAPPPEGVAPVATHGKAGNLATKVAPAPAPAPALPAEAPERPPPSEQPSAPAPPRLPPKDEGLLGLGFP